MFTVFRLLTVVGWEREEGAVTAALKGEESGGTETQRNGLLAHGPISDLWK